MDIETVKAWETGRRPLVNASGKVIRHVRLHLRRSGVAPRLIGLLEPAMEADLFYEQVVAGEDPRCWVLANVVGWRELFELIFWPITGRAPAAIRNLADVTSLQPLRPGELSIFFDHLQRGADRPLTGPLLRRQAYFLSGVDRRSDSKSWLASVERDGLVSGAGKEWPGGWATLRSLAVARACQGDPGLLQSFISRHLADDDLAETASIVYWAYWLEPPEGGAESDTFMSTTHPDQVPLGKLLRHLAAQLSESQPFVDLSVHSTDALIRRYPRLLLSDREAAAGLANTAASLLDGGTGYAPTRRALDRIHYTAKFARESV
ncbi:hypothetical protein JOD67_001758 [Tenggerimyces flavus]|nr:hypothetical protein [Tenggerimyces flavus]